MCNSFWNKIKPNLSTQHSTDTLVAYLQLSFSVLSLGWATANGLDPLALGATLLAAHAMCKIGELSEKQEHNQKRKQL